VHTPHAADAFHKIWAIHKERGCPLRVAAYILALQEVTRAEIHRGFD
jgi:glutamate dehydrogenase (NAD(P)+)